ncbi:MAG: hypothetical protein Q8L52_03765 [bacterium]|nr:hypothetical protein [bacterium]
MNRDMFESNGRQLGLITKDEFPATEPAEDRDPKKEAHPHHAKFLADAAEHLFSNK